MQALKIYTEGQAVDKLEQFGLNDDNFIYALSKAIYESKRSSPLHPRNDSMLRAWSETVASFRESVIMNDSGWSYVLTDGLELTINSTLGLSVVVSSGDKDTGLADGSPRTKNAKGNATKNIVNNNQTLELFSSNEVTPITDTVSPVDSTKTYVFLYFFDLDKQEVRCELSLPDGMSNYFSQNKIDSWAERIILPSVSFSSAVEPNKHKQEEFTEEFDIPVSRK
ncbi:hypothetical protein [Photorhabdus khanii]|uniref:Uncharacterized protein n=1 Tax=Photorhabdus khanii subsp. guanajuatensis TaxID=2100166 RepID=A0A4R4J409_9GAMM|nr:hypothetical protein [Photorhabdus khanii]TDB48258.1 hypothetical protein C5467_19490 [Photorhabdus khanii subsp. guanajuatensis]